MRQLPESTTTDAPSDDLNERLSRLEAELHHLWDSPLQPFGVDEYIAWNLPTAGEGNTVVRFQNTAGAIRASDFDADNRWLSITTTLAPVSGPAGFYCTAREQAWSMAAQEPEFTVTVRNDKVTTDPRGADMLSHASCQRHVYGLTSGEFSGATEPAYGCYFFLGAANTWECVTRFNGAETRTLTTVEASSERPQPLGITMATPTRVEFAIDGVVVAAHIEDVPTGAAVLIPTLAVMTCAGPALGQTIQVQWANYFSVRYRTRGAGGFIAPVLPA